MTQVVEMWSEHEEEVVRAHYPEHGAQWEGWAELLPGRTLNAIQNRAYRLGVRYCARWSGNDVAVLRFFWPLVPPGWAGWPLVLPSHGHGQIARKARVLGLAEPPRSTRGKLTNGARRDLVVSVNRAAKRAGVPFLTAVAELNRLCAEQLARKDG